MSWQQVNLYLPELQPSQEWLTFNRMLGVCAAALVVLAVMSTMAVFETGSLKREIADKQAAMAQGQEAIAQLLAVLPRSQAAQVQRELDELQAELARRERIYGLINQQDVGNSDGFANQLYALSRQHQPQLALHSFALQRGGQAIDLQGEALSAEAVPQYIQRLQYEPAFERAVFGRLVLERQRSGRVTFALSHGEQMQAAGGANGQR